MALPGGEEGVPRKGGSRAFNYSRSGWKSACPLGKQYGSFLSRAFKILTVSDPVIPQLRK